MIPKDIEDKLLVKWHQTFSHRKNEFDEAQKAMRLELQRQGLLGFDRTIIYESLRQIWR